MLGGRWAWGMVRGTKGVCRGKEEGGPEPPYFFSPRLTALEVCTVCRHQFYRRGTGCAKSLTTLVSQSLGQLLSRPPQNPSSYRFSLG